MDWAQIWSFLSKAQPLMTFFAGLFLPLRERTSTAQSYKFRQRPNNFAASNWSLSGARLMVTSF